MTASMIVANWKMHGGHGLATQLLDACADFAWDTKRYEGVLMVPYVYLDRTQRLLSGSSWQWRGQNCHHQDQAAQTGEISAPMLRDFGCQYVLIGHSERRTHHHEDNDLLRQKWCAAVAAGLTPILCVGESAEERASGQANAAVQAQLQAVFSGYDFACMPDKWVVAYEPVWAIGTGRVPSCEEIAAMHQWMHAQMVGFSLTYRTNTITLWGQRE